MNAAVATKIGATIATTAALALLALTYYAPLADLPGLLFKQDAGSFSELFLRLALIPRFCVAVMAGIALGLCGAIFQQVLRNPLAEPSTLGVMSGAHFAITLASLSLAAITDWQRELFGLAGAFGALAVVMKLARPSSFSPLPLLLAGMMTNFALGSASVVLSLFHHEYLRSAFIWASGSLIQNDFSNASALFLRLLIFVPPIFLLLRPLTVLGLDDASAASLGIPTGRYRAILLALATALAASVTARTGVVAFIGLAAPNLAKLMGARTSTQRMIFSPMIGAALLVSTDSLVLIASRLAAEVPTGSVTAAVGGIFMLVMLRSAAHVRPRALDVTSSTAPSGTSVNFVLPLLSVLLVLSVVLSLFDTVQVVGLSTAEAIAGRWPRAAMSMSAGAMLAMAGFMTQSATGNPMASPEGLGVTSGAALGIIFAMFTWGFSSPLLTLAGGAGGAAVTLLATLMIARRSDYSPAQLLLTGVAVGSLSTAIISVIIASGDPRAPYVLAWTMGPTFRATSLTATVSLVLLTISLTIAPLFSRGLRILPLGDEVARSIGLSPARTRVAILLFCAVVTAASTLLIGPLSFVGLMAPHLARKAVPGGGSKGMLAAALVGASLMVSADWIGRVVDFPYEIPAGVIASLIGTPYFFFAFLSDRKG